MRETIQKLHHNRIFALIIWLMAVFIAIVALPNIEGVIQYNGQPQLPNSSQPIKASNVANHWGRNLDGTYTVNVVFNNSDGAITPTQQTALNKTVSRLQEKNRYYGIQQITTMTNTPTSQPQLLSKDRSTEIVQLAVNRSQGTVREISKQLTTQVTTSGLKTYVTSPEIINDVANQHISSLTLTVLLISLLLALIAMGILFWSLVAPIITFLVILISYGVSLSLASNLAVRGIMPFSEYLPIALMVAVTLFGLFGSFWFFRAFRETIATQEDPQAATQKVLRQLRYRFGLITGVLTIGFGALGFFNFSTIRAYAFIGVAFLLTGLAILTLVPVFTGMLGVSLYWPRTQQRPVIDRQLWTRLAKFGLWQPWIALVVVLYLVGPFAYSYHNFLTYGAERDNSGNQAVVGARVLRAHFGQGKTTPITVYIKGQNQLADTNQLLAVDRLTKKLQATSGVASVTSVTQPGGMPVTQYYVNNQLDTLTQELSGSMKTLTQISKKLKQNRGQLKTSTLTKEATKLQTLATKANSLVSQSSTLSSHLSAAKSSANVSGSRSNKTTQYINALNNVSQQLSSASTTLSDLSTTATSTNADLSSSASFLNSYATTINSVAASLKNSQDQLTKGQKQLNNIYKYLTGFQQSDLAKELYLTPEQLQSGDFQQALYNFTDQSQKVTKLIVTLNAAPSAHTQATIQDLQQTINTETRGSRLANDRVALAGQPVVQATIQAHYQQALPLIVALIAGILLLTLMVAARAILQPLYWTVTFVVSSLAGFQLTHLLLKWMTGYNDFNWQVPLIALIPLSVIATGALIDQAISYRYSQEGLLDWIEPAMTASGQTVRHVIFIVMITMIALILTTNTTLIAVGLATILTTIIFYLVQPIITAALGKLAVTLPANKPHMNRHG